MPAPKTASRYGVDYFRLLEIARNKFDTGETSFSLPMKSEKAATRFRFRFYSFRKAIERDIKSHLDPETIELRRQQFKIADIIRIRIVPQESGVKLVFENATTCVSSGDMALADALDAIEMELFEKQQSEVPDFDAMADAEAKTLDSLGVDVPERASDLFKD